ncbi:MAG TPA: response regulator, partial [Burkholderiales bacterium]
MRDVQETLAADFSTTSAESLPDAQRRLDEEPPDCVVVAYHFDEMQSFHLIRHIREHPRCADVPIILV